MTSISDFDYRHFCSELIYEALEKPSMYFRTLEELQSIMFGHYFAYMQLGAITARQSFSNCFVEWLRKTSEVSFSLGWADGIEQMALETDLDSVALFSQLVREFLSRWILGVGSKKSSE